MLCSHFVATCICACITGVPEVEQPTRFERARKKTSIPGNLNLEQLEDFIIQLYPRVPQLGRVGFLLAKATKMRQLVILHCASVEELRQEVKKGQLILVPKRDLLPSAVVTTFWCSYFTLLVHVCL